MRFHGWRFYRGIFSAKNCTVYRFTNSSNDYMISGITVGVPAGLWGDRKQFTAVEARYSREMASARVHVERMIGFLDVFLYTT